MSEPISQWYKLFLWTGTLSHSPQTERAQGEEEVEEEAQKSARSASSRAQMQLTLENLTNRARELITPKVIEALVIVVSTLIVHPDCNAALHNKNKSWSIWSWVTSPMKLGLPCI